MKPKLFNYFFSGFAILFFALSLQTTAQETEKYKHLSSDLVTIFSKTLQEERKIYIHCPRPDSTNRNKKYPVLYLMDGESHFDMLCQYTEYLSRWDVDKMPEMIVVGITNTKRTRDLTPTESNLNYFGKPDTSRVSWMKPSGGNEKFLQFIKNELVPYIEHHYKTQPYKILAGHSFGGLSAINCMLTHPELFDAYIAVSPSFWWDNDYLLTLAKRKLPQIPLTNKTLFYSDASEGISDSSSFHTNLLKFDSLLTNSAPAKLNHLYKYYPTETHMTEPLLAYHDALRFIYKDWKKNDKGH